MTVQLTTEVGRQAVAAGQLGEGMAQHFEALAADVAHVARTDTFEAAVSTRAVALWRGFARNVIMAMSAEMLAAATTGFGDAAAIAAKLCATVPRFDFDAALVDPTASKISLTPAQYADGKRRVAELNDAGFAVSGMGFDEAEKRLGFGGYLGDRFFNLTATPGGWHASVSVSRAEEMTPPLVAPWAMQPARVDDDFSDRFEARAASTAELIDAMGAFSTEPRIKNAERAATNLAAAAEELKSARIPFTASSSHVDTEDPVFKVNTAVGDATIRRTTSDWSITVVIPKATSKTLDKPWTDVGAGYQGGGYIANAVFGLRAPTAADVAAALHAIR